MDKYMFRKRNALSRKECEHVIRLFENSNPQLSTHKYYSVSPSMSETQYIFLRSVLNDNLVEYGKKHTFLGKRYERYWNIDDVFNIQRYNPGAYYDSDYDVVYWEGHAEHGHEKVSVRRMVAWMFYLNNIKNDGGTRWPQQRFTTKPKAGDLYIWPAFWTHSHYGVPAPDETKYIITGWCSWNDLDG